MSLLGLSKKRIDELTKNFETMDDEDFLAWIEAQPDSEKLNVAILDLMRINPHQAETKKNAKP